MGFPGSPFPGLPQPVTFSTRFQDIAPLCEPIQKGASEQLAAKIYAMV
jgi:hypothetical protein